MSCRTHRPGVLACLAVALVLVAATARARGPEIGQPAPLFEATLLDGEKFSTAKTGDVVLVHFWATWCEPCRKEMPAFDAYYRQHRDEGLKIVAVSMDEPEDIAKVREVMRAFSFPAAMQGDVHASGYGRIWRLPLTFVVDRKGILRKDGWVGSATLDAADLDKTVTPLLQQR